MNKRQSNLFATLLVLMLALYCSSEEDRILSKVGKPGDREIAQTHYEAAHKLHVQGDDLTAAKSLYLKAFEADPSWWRPLYQLGCVHSLLAETDKAITFLKGALKAEVNPEILRYLDSDSDLANVRKHPGFSNLKVEAYGEFAPVIDKELFCTVAAEMMDGRADTMTRKLHSNGSITGRDLPPDHNGSTMNAYSFQGGNWRIAGDKLILTESIRHDWSSIAMMQDQVGTVESRERTYISLKEFTSQFSKANCDVASTF